MAAAGVLIASNVEGGGPEQGSLFFDQWRTRHIALALAALWAALVLGLGSRSRRAALGAAVLALEVAGLALGVDWSTLLAGGGKLTLGHEAVPHVEAEGLAQQDIAFACGLDFEKVPYSFRSDQRGFRNELDRDAADVYLLGDSFIVAGLVRSEDLISARLERSLARPVMNVALSGISPQEERDLLLATGLPLEGRTVIHFVFEGNDLEDSARFERGDHEEHAGRSTLDRTLTLALVIHLQRLSQSLVREERCSIGLLDGQPYLFGWIRSSFDGYEEQCGVITEALGRFAQEVTARGGRYGVVLIPAKIRVLGPYCTWPADSTLSGFESHLGPLRDHLSAWAASSGTPYLDLTGLLAESVAAGRVPWFPADTHWNAIGHEIVAAGVESWLSALPSQSAGGTSGDR